MDTLTFRRSLHGHPELSFQEHHTARFIGEQLTAEGIEWHTVAQTGLLAKIEGRGNLHRAVVLRADIDALPIHEEVAVAWRSQNEGVMHACGHDMHATVLFGVLKELAATPHFEGTVFGLFQPGEECNPGGASKVLAENPFDGYDVAAVIGEHVEPDLEVGTFGFRAGKYMASNDELRLVVEGIGGHAALRGRIRDAIRSAATLVIELTDMNTTQRILSIGRFTADGATNVIPDQVRLEGTMRTFDAYERLRTLTAIERLCRKIEQKDGVSITMDINHGYPCVINDPALTALAEELATQKYKAVKLDLRPTAEDFGFYGTKYPALFYRLGVGAAAGKLHTATFCPDERALSIGIALMRELTLKILDK
ncbi:MAG: M20 family metallopeptidase [Alistipes sp.]